MNAVREAVRKAFERRRAELQDAAKPSRDAFDKLKEQESAFAEKGELPAQGVRLGDLRARVRAARQAMLGRYSVAAEELLRKEATRSQSDAVEEERKRFEAEADLVPWGPNLVEGVASPERVLSPERSSVSFDATPADEYRIEVLITVREPGPIVVEIPIGDGRRLSVPSIEGSGVGSRRVILSVRSDFVSADLDATRPLPLSGATESDSKAIVVSAEGATATVDSIRLKPILPAPDDAQARPLARPAAAKEKADPNAVYIEGKTWEGRRSDGGISNIVLKSRNDDTVVFEFEGFYTGAVWRVTGKLQNGVVKFYDGDRIRNPAGHAAMVVKNPGGGARINADGSLDFQFTGRSTGNGVIDFRFDNAQPK